MSQADWTFEDATLAQNFDSYVRHQLPWYDLATGAVAHYARHYAPQNGLIVDVGAATGNIGRALSGLLYERACTFVPVESSAAMANAYDGPGVPLVADIQNIELDAAPDVVISFLTAMFLPAKTRGEWLQRTVGSLAPGGALILVERMEQGSGYPGTIAARLTLRNKLDAGASAEEIIEKELSLQGVQVPLRPHELPENAVEFFRLGDFAGFVIESTA